VRVTSNTASRTAATASNGVSRSEPMSSQGNDARRFGQRRHTLSGLGEARGVEIPMIAVAGTTVRLKADTTSEVRLKPDSTSMAV